MSEVVSKNLYSEMDEFLKYEIIQRHSYFQLKYFLIGKEPTVQAKMWQCLRELKSRKDSLIAIDLETEDTKDKIELLEISLAKLCIKEEEISESKISDLQKKEIAIEKRQLERQKKLAGNSLIDLQERKKWIEEECRFFIDTFKNLSKEEALKHFDDLESQKQYWAARLSQKLNLKMLTHNQLDTELVETIIALPDDMLLKKQTLGTLEMRNNVMCKQLQETMNMLENKSRETK